ncbi:hypothetical protein ACO2Q8_15585 [Larkinella sp. VNQ87]|uniref:hypothetical protein n=1 Tax=Larkinella sp. VNQ87 TaxID=3400921 RepID=UPI003C0E3FD4
MTNLEIVLVLMSILAALTSVTQKLKSPYPILFLVAGLMVNHQRDRIIHWHKEGTYSEETLRRIEQKLDIRSLSLETQLNRLKLVEVKG